MFWLWYIVIGAVAGWLGGLIVRGSGAGLLLNIVVGVIGGVLGGWLFGLVGLQGGNMVWSLLTAIVGAILLLLLIGLLNKKRK